MKKSPGLIKKRILISFLASFLFFVISPLVSSAQAEPGKSPSTVSQTPNPYAAQDSPVKSNEVDSLEIAGVVLLALGAIFASQLPNRALNVFFKKEAEEEVYEVKVGE